MALTFLQRVVPDVAVRSPFESVIFASLSVLFHIANRAHVKGCGSATHELYICFTSASDSALDHTPHSSTIKLFSINDELSLLLPSENPSVYNTADPAPDDATVPCTTPSRYRVTVVPSYVPTR